MMKKYITLILLLALFLPVSAFESAAADMPMSAQIDEQGPVITVRGNNLTVFRAEGQVLEIYNLAGLRVAAFKVESNEQTFNSSLPKGCYILKVGKLVRKISIG